MTRATERVLEALPRGFRKRTLKSAKLATKLGAGYLRRAVTGRSRRGDTGGEAEEASARQLVEELGSLKGLAMKLGQIASYVPGAMSPTVQRVLSDLQANTTPMAFDAVAQMVHTDLGGAVDDRFDAFERRPFAAASIGQVHRARVEGRPVAVKIQYPGIEDVLRADVGKLDMLARVATFGTAFDGKALAKELGSRVLEECDYVAEAGHQRMFGELLRSVDGARVPGVVGSHSSRRVLTSELVEGQSFQSFCDDASQAERDRAGAILFRTCFESIFVHCVFNADPHPGNYLMHEGGDVTFLDFGCVRHFDAEMIDAWKATAVAVLERDWRGFRDGFVAMGLVPDPDRFDWDHQWKVMQYIYRPYTEPGFRFTPQYVTESYGLLIFDNPNRKRSAMPPAWLLLNRLQWGLNAILGHLHAQAPWGEIWRDVTGAPTRPVETAA